MQSLISQHIHNIPLHEELTYKQICELLRIPRYGGNQKTAQLRELSRYIRYSKDKKYIIEEIYKTPLPKIQSSRSIYTKHITQILLFYLSRQTNPVYISSHKLYYVLGLVNQKYISMQSPQGKKMLHEQLKSTNDTPITDKDLKKFYDKCSTKFSSIVSTCLKSLETQGYIKTSKAYRINREVCDIDGTLLEVYSTYSTEEETALIQEIEKQVMKEYGYQKEYEIWRNTKGYFNRVNELCRYIHPEICGIYRTHKIYLIKNLTNEMEIINEQRILNNKIQEYLKGKVPYFLIELLINIT